MQWASGKKGITHLLLHPSSGHWFVPNTMSFESKQFTTVLQKTTACYKLVEFKGTCICMQTLLLPYFLWKRLWKLLSSVIHQHVVYDISLKEWTPRLTKTDWTFNKSGGWVMGNTPHLRFFPLAVSTCVPTGISNPTHHLPPSLASPTNLYLV